MCKIVSIRQPDGRGSVQSRDRQGAEQLDTLGGSGYVYEKALGPASKASRDDVLQRFRNSCFYQINPVTPFFIFNSHMQSRS